MSRLYLITPPKFELPAFKQELTSAFSGGDVAVLQLRMKGTSSDDIKRVAEVIQPICSDNNVLFIVNDDPDLAVKLGADGVHVGEDDCTAAEARSIVGGDMVVGVSCYASKHRAMVAGEEGADYVAFGAFYPTKTKKPRGFPTVELLKFWSESTIIPSVAIGGIKPDNAAPLVKAGADFIAVVTGIWEYPEGAEIAVKRFNETLGQIK